MPPILPRLTLAATLVALWAGMVRADITTGRAVHLTLQENDGTTTYTNTGSLGGTVSLTGAASTGAISVATGPGGVYPRAALLDGTDDRIGIPDLAATMTDTFSVAWWADYDVATPPSAPTAGVLHLGPNFLAGGSVATHLPWIDGNFYNGIGRTTSNVAHSRVGPYAPPATISRTAQHMHVVMSTPGANGWQHYMYDPSDNELVLAGQTTGITGIDWDNGANVWLLGRSSTTTTTYQFKGQMAGLSIYPSRKLTTTEILELAAQGQNNPVITNDGSVTMDEGEVQVEQFEAYSGTAVVWSITGGADAAMFGINGLTGELTFTVAPQVTDGSPFAAYAVEVTATSDTGSTELAVTVRVNDIPPSTVGSNIFVDWLAWVDWKDDRIAWFESHCPLARATTYHFSPSGNDTTGDGSIGNPYRSRAKAITLTAANTALLFQCGGEYEGIADWNVNVDGVTVGPYGSGAMPLFDGFDQNYLATADVWTNPAGNRWTTAETDTIAWLRLTADRLGEVQGTHLIRVANAAAVEATTFSWHWAANVLHVNLGVFSPNDVDLEGVVANTNDGVEMQADGGRVEGIRADGFGMHPTTTASQSQPFTSRSSGDEANYFKDCEAYFSGSHVVAHNQPSGTGGVTMFRNIIAGYPKYNGLPGDNCFNSFSSGGDAETWFIDCQGKYGTLKDYNWDYATLKARGQGFYAHTDGGTLHRLQIMFGCTAPDSHTPLAFLGSVGATQTTVNPEDYTLARTFRVNCQFGPMSVASNQFPSSPAFFPSHAIVYGERQYLNPIHTNPGAFENVNTTNCWYANSIIDVDGTALTDEWGIVNVVSGTYSVHLWHSMIRERNSSFGFWFDYDTQFGSFAPGAGPAQNCSALNSIFACGSGGSLTNHLGLTNSAWDGDSGLESNAYLGFDGDVGDERGFDADPDPVTLTSLPGLGGAPIVCRHTGSEDIPLFSHDINGRARTGLPTIGPFAGGGGLLQVLMESAQ